MDAAKHQIIELLANYGPMTASELSSETNISFSTVLQALYELQGAVKNNGMGVWDLEDEAQQWLDNRV